MLNSRLPAVRVAASISAMALVATLVFCIRIGAQSPFPSETIHVRGTIPGLSPQNSARRGQGHNSDWNTAAPGVRHLITPADLPKPFVTRSVDRGPKVVPRPTGAWPKAPSGFIVAAYVTGLQEPRAMATAPNGDILVSESHANRVRILRGINKGGKPISNSIFASGLRLPFGIADRF